MATKKLTALAVRTPNGTPEERARGAMAAGAKWIAKDIVVALLNELNAERMRACELEEKLEDVTASLVEVELKPEGLLS